MKLEVGKSYRRRDGGGPVKIIQDDGSSMPFLTDSRAWYYRDGRFNPDGTTCPIDLVEEWVEPELRIGTLQNDDGTFRDDFKFDLGTTPAKPDWYWGFWEYNYKVWFEMLKDGHVSLPLAASDFADAACAERMKREK